MKLRNFLENIKFYSFINDYLYYGKSHKVNHAFYVIFDIHIIF
jgi:hypothetical protein